MNKKLNRRKFVKSTLGAGALLAGTRISFSQNTVEDPADKRIKHRYDPKGLPTAVLGKTGIVIPRLVFGLGSRFCNIAILDEAIDLCNYALDNGLYYWDTAHTYENAETGAISEERLGHVVKYRRDEIFLSTKVSARDPEKAKLEIEDSLRRLQTDHLDMLKIHAVETTDEVNTILQKGNLLDIITRLKEEKVTRFIGFSGHGNAQALKMMAETGRFDSMLFAMNHYGGDKDNRQGEVIPAAKAKGMGVLLMKAVRPKETIKDIDPGELVRFAFSLEGPDGIVVGMESRKVMDANLNILRNFKPMNEAEKQRYAVLLSPFFRHENLEWMREGYHDGYWG